LAILGLVTHDQGFTQTMTPTPEQLEIFKSLSPDQQQMILQQLGSGLGQGGALGGARGGRSTETQPATAEGRGAEERQTESTQPLVPVLKGDDTIIVEIDFRLPPKQVATIPYGQYAAGAAGGAFQGPNDAASRAAAAQLQGVQAPAPPAA